MSEENMGGKMRVRGFGSRLLPVLVVILVVAGCSSTQHAPMHPQSTAKTIDSAAASPADADAVIFSAVANGDPGVTEIEIYPGTGDFINQDAAQRRPDVVSEDGEIVLNFEGESIQAVVHTILGEVLQETFVIAPGVGGEVTFSTSRPVTREQLMPILELLLQWNGATMVYNEGRYHILPVADAIKGHLTPLIGSAEKARGYEVRAIPLKYISAIEMEKILQPYVRDGAIVRVDKQRSMIFPGGHPGGIAQLHETLSQFLMWTGWQACPWAFIPCEPSMWNPSSVNWNAYSVEKAIRPWPACFVSCRWNAWAPSW